MNIKSIILSDNILTEDPASADVMQTREGGVGVYFFVIFFEILFTFWL